MTKILVLFTGGTIGSIRVPTEIVNGKQHFIDGTKAELDKLHIDCGNRSPSLIERYKKRYRNSGIEFNTTTLTDILSENMTFSKWNIITSKLREIDFSGYDGIIITHGTDTLGYFANYMSMILGDVNKPVCIVSSNHVLEGDDPFVNVDDKANGDYNFQTACDFIKNIGLPGVYVPYRNEDDKATSVIYGSRIMQCNPYTNKFESLTSNGFVPLLMMDEFGQYQITDEAFFNTLNGTNTFNKGINSYININYTLKSNILLIDPFVNINYGNYNLKNVDIVLHGLYHSGTACSDEETVNNIINFYRQIRNSGSDLFVGPFNVSDDKELYASCDKMIKAGIKFVTNTSKENAYLTLALAHAVAPSFDVKPNELSEFLEDFMYEELNYEFYKPPVRIKRL